MRVLDWAREVQALGQTGLAYAKSHYDRERYQRLVDLTAEMLGGEIKGAAEQLRSVWSTQSGYSTPKVDVRAAVFQGDRILLVREREEGLWSIPGGWAEVNTSPSEAVVKEVKEESGYRVQPRKLAALLDRNRHPHPPMFDHLYKIFFVCEVVGGEATTSYETDAVDFFSEDSLPPLSVARVTEAQIARLFEHWRQPELATDFD